METSPCQSPSKASGFGTMSVMMTETTSLEDQVANLTKLVEGFSTSLKAKDHEIARESSIHRPGGKLNSTLVFVCEAVHPKNRPVKDASKLPTTKVSTIRWQGKSSATRSSLCGDLQQCRD
jgi:hypothetical protein